MQLITFLFALLVSFSVFAQDPSGELLVPVADQELTIIRYPAEGTHLAIWLMPGLGEPTRMLETAVKLSGLGVEVWLVDLAESLFLIKGPQTMRTIDGKYVSGLIAAAHARTGKTITVIGRGYSAIPTLRGIQHWQQAQQNSGETATYLSGAILFSPELYATVPALGLEPVYEPIVDATNVPIILYQAEKGGNRWQLGKLLSRLEKGGATVYVQVMPGVTGLFYDDDESPATLNALKRSPAQIVRGLDLLDKTPTPGHALPLADKAAGLTSGLDSELTAFHGNPSPPPINLADAKGQYLSRDDYRGKVTLVNFWATWCGPCVEEIPSLNNLREQMADESFELISINYAEGAEQVRKFMGQVKVDFPVLLDEDGTESAKWNVLVFPSTFVIGPNGQIVYGVNGAIHWDAPEVVNQLRALHAP